jgi:transposase InsO family protein
VASGLRLSLTNVLYVPNSKIRLLSVSSLNRSGNYVTHFDSSSCWVTNRSGATIIRGALSSKRQLYTVTLTSASVTHVPRSPTALYASRTPDVETWHRRLGHCNVRSIIEMARKEAVEGMTIDLSSTPAKCTHCVLGKQTRSPVPKIREGPKATERLGRVFVDLCGPMPTVSRSGRLYSMHVIDDFSSYVWSLPLRSKADAASVFQLWHKHVTTQTGLPLKVLVTDNGELVSKSMKEWCLSLGIDHVVTAPHTSAQNGRAERVHRTILGKARAMRLACHAPSSLWDEFCATAAYLTNFTATPTLNHKTSYELWFGRRPSLSHLREIGCTAFALIQTHNPKIYQRSNPCILVGYAPNSKAYRLWDSSSGKLFNSFHVTFIEHLDALPSSLLPGTTVQIVPGSPPSWDSPSLDMLPSAPISAPVLPAFPPSASSHPPSASIPSSSLLPYVPNPNHAIETIPSIHNTNPDIENVPPNTVNQNTQSTISPTVPVIETIIPNNTSQLLCEI